MMGIAFSQKIVPKLKMCLICLFSHLFTVHFDIKGHQEITSYKYREMMIVDLLHNFAFYSQNFGTQQGFPRIYLFIVFLFLSRQMEAEVVYVPLRGRCIEISR